MTTPGSVRWFAHQRPTGWTCPAPSAAAHEFHRGLADYEPTPLVELPTLAAELGVGHVLAKDESSRLGLPAFKALGASWAVHRALDSRSGSGRQVTVVAATDGNHGRAVARFAHMLGHRASIVVPNGVHPSAVQAIVDEGAELTAVDGSYDDAVAFAEQIARADDSVLVQDTAWVGYEEIPRWIVEGYETLFAEVDQQLRDAHLADPDLVIVPVGVGSLLQAAISHYRWSPSATGTAVMSVEPEAAACVAPSLVAGHPVTVPTGSTIMAGLNCGTPSNLAWPFIAGGLDAAVAVSDAEDVRAARDLAALQVPAGPCGAAALAAARFALTGLGSGERRAHLGIAADSCVVLLVTEGSAANPAAL
jgi:diaminopropionate ammonia-lyase